MEGGIGRIIINLNNNKFKNEYLKTWKGEKTEID